jgi:hypothetical protein
MLIPLSFSLAFGSVDDFTTNKSLYYEGDTLYVSGTVSSDLDSPNVTIVIFNPGKSTFVTLGSAIANSDGSFSATLLVGGPTWSTYGIYPIQVTSEGSSMEKSIEYSESSTTTPEPTPEPSSTSESIPEPTPEPSSIPEPPSKQSSTFTTLKFQIPNFPSLDKSPQYYIDRYNTESDYKSWFDSQFPGISIYNILGYEDPVSVPDWIRNNAEWWASGAITDSTFVTGIEFMLENNIIMISNIPSGGSSSDEIPDWIRNNAHWWSQDLISEDEFVNSLKFLIKEGIISVN